jgi:nucleotide-binding universal stress UspA family protein
VRIGYGAQMGTVVVGYVPKPEGEAALTAAIAEAKLRSSTLVVVNSHRGGDAFDGEKSVKAESELEAVKKRLADAGVEFEVRQLVRGFEPAEDLIGIAESSDAELIVIGLRRRTPVGKLILGSNAQRILLDARCPVLAVKPD